MVMRLVYFFLFMLLVYPAAVFAASVNVNIEGMILSEIKEAHTISEGLLSSSPELYNAGSVSYAARVRLLVEDNSNEIFSSWSAKDAVMPGERNDFNIFAYIESPGNYTARLFGHYANDAFLLTEYNFSVTEHISASRSIMLSKPRIYDNKITISVASETGESGVAIMPVGYPKTWIFEQKTLSALPGKKTARISIPYDADIFSEKEIKLIAVSLDGEAFGQIEFPMKREHGFYKYISLINDWICGAR
ncbi:MAG: hypothetical protein KAJ91_02390 [Candidatus Aenigmarchaeota archaeon]|nr:hypothetical protein [Candidatus Aenigmarchaeota archaeon]